MDIEQVIIHKGMARSLFASTWADEMEEQGRVFPPQTDVINAAPETPVEAVYAAYRLAGAVEEANKSSLVVLIYAASRADGKNIGEMTDEALQEYAGEFGHSLIMEALGHGVSWFDNHELFDLNIPDFENPISMIDAAQNKGEFFK